MRFALYLILYLTVYDCFYWIVYSHMTEDNYWSVHWQPFIDTTTPYGVQYTCICHFINIVTLSNINVTPKLKLLLQKLQGHHHDLVDRYGIFISQIQMDLLLFSLSSITAKTDQTLLCIWVTLCVYYKKQRTLYLSWALAITPIFWVG